RGARGPARGGARGGALADGRTEEGGARRAPGDRREDAVGAVGRGAGRGGGSRGAGGARAAEPRVRGALRLSLRRLREPAAQGGDPANPARAAGPDTRAGARHRAGRARRDRGGSLETRMIEIAAGPFRFGARFEEEGAPQAVAAFRRAGPLGSQLIEARG